MILCTTYVQVNGYAVRTRSLAISGLTIDRPAPYLSLCDFCGSALDLQQPPQLTQKRLDLSHLPHRRQVSALVRRRLRALQP